ncbi:helix-turn-helix transcriptional regulator [Croceicoccus sp. F390]|uniref:Helix-turn-helix transcriptional regulator n=1 Tax=Croceicoccus esteveae TaxID=3075597 RepID=A0ABU2ZHK0_9SPHN|nr:helix-turn-helix transcriptional regulator [Croceicoccus sp. F390]MDT0575865.1 helix-turn-helix transcriptional regulator [Croceicoccus sp. F390]
MQQPAQAKYHTMGCRQAGAFQFEHIRQDGRGPFEQTHRLDRPSVVYLRNGSNHPALGCLGQPTSHRSFTPFGVAALIPANLTLHVRSPEFQYREMIIMRFDEAQLGTMSPANGNAPFDELVACIDLHGADLIQALDRLARELVAPRHASDTILQGLGLLITGELARCLAELRHARLGRRGMLAPWQIARIEDHLTGLIDTSGATAADCSVDELARLCGIGRRHLMRAYKATTGITVMEQVTRRRFDAAVRMLEHSDAPLKTIAWQLGFSSQGNFSTAFRRRFGQSPGQWRAQRRTA